jgi:hypothetical protein
MKPIRNLLFLPLVLCGSFAISTAQAPQQPTATPRDSVVEVTYYKGRPFAYQAVGGWTWYDFFPRISGWKPRSGELPVEAVKLYVREEADGVRVKITVLRGRNLEIEDFVADYAVGPTKTAVRELSDFGVTPFEISLVRAPKTVAALPEITNVTKSLDVSVEPVISSLPAFKARFLNTSAKPVAGFAYQTSIDGRTKISAMPQNRDGGELIAPGAPYDLTIRYPTAPITESTGEIPEASHGLQLNVLAVIFADGSYEGEAIQAARLRGYKLGEKIQLTRLLELLHSKSAASSETFAAKVDQLPYAISTADVGPLTAEFPSFPESEVENLRSAAEVSSSYIQKAFKSTFGRGASIDQKVFPDAIKGAIAKCEKWLNSLP